MYSSAFPLAVTSILLASLIIADAASAQSDFEIKPRGRLQIDAIAAGDDDSGSSNVRVRRLYLGAKGKLSARLRFQADVDFANEEVTPQDIYLAYELAEKSEMVAGYFKPPNVIDELTSDVQTLFLERSLYSGIFAPGRRNGAGANLLLNGTGIQAGIFDGRGGDFLRFPDGGWLVSARLYRGVPLGGGTLHIAGSAYREELPAQSLRLQQRPEASMAPVLVDTGIIRADHAFFTGAELGFGKGPVTVQAEGGRLALGGASAHPHFRGGSAQIAFRWTGEERRYDAGSGTYGRVSPSSPLGKGGWGALETGLRVSHVDLDDAGIAGGTLSTFGAVVNWFPIERLRLSVNVIHASPAGSSKGRQADDSLTFRIAYDF